MVNIRNLETPPKKGHEPRKHWGRYLHPMVLLGYTQSWTIPTTPQWWICTAGLLYVLDFTAAKCLRPNFFWVVAWNPYWQWPLAFENYFLSFWPWNTSEIANLAHVAAFHEAEVFALVVWTKKHSFYRAKKKCHCRGALRKSRSHFIKSWAACGFPEKQQNLCKGNTQILGTGVFTCIPLTLPSACKYCKYLRNITIQMFFFGEPTRTSRIQDNINPYDRAVCLWNPFGLGLSCCPSFSWPLGHHRNHQCASFNYWQTYYPDWGG